MPQVKSNILRPSSYTTHDPSPFIIRPSVILPIPWLMCLTPNACRSCGGFVFVCNDRRWNTEANFGSAYSFERNLKWIWIWRLLIHRALLTTQGDSNEEPSSGFWTYWKRVYVTTEVSGAWLTSGYISQSLSFPCVILCFRPVSLLWVYLVYHWNDLQQDQNKLQRRKTRRNSWKLWCSHHERIWNHLETSHSRRRNWRVTTVLIQRNLSTLLSKVAIAL